MNVVSEIASDFEDRLHACYEPGFGVMPSNKHGVFYGQLWARDFAYAAGSYLSGALPGAVRDSLETLFSHQRNDGALPYKVEREYALVRIIPGFQVFARPLFKLIEKNEERALYEGEDTNGAEDTIPAIIIATGMYLATNADQSEGSRYYGRLKKAMEHFVQRTDPIDGLVLVQHTNPDWAESIQRTGKLGFVNVLFVQALWVMSCFARRVQKNDDAVYYEREYARCKASLLDSLYDSEEGYFRTCSGEDRMDTAASIFGALFFLDAPNAQKVEESVVRRAGSTHGLRNFDPPYPERSIHIINRVFGTSGYHNSYLWPWVSCQNIHLMEKIAVDHSNPEIRKKYKEHAVKSLEKMAIRFKAVGGGYEVWRQDRLVPARSLFYSPPRNFLASLTGFLGAHRAVKNRGWI